MSVRMGVVFTPEVKIQMNVVWVTSMRANGRPLTAETRLVAGVRSGFAQTSARTAMAVAKEEVPALAKVTKAKTLRTVMMSGSHTIALRKDSLAAPLSLAAVAYVSVG